MDMYSVVKENPILAILRNIPLEYTVDYAQAIVDGGISFFEVALNSEHGLKQIAILRDRFGEKCMIGAGTAISVDLAKAAIGAGAQFLLTPGTPIDVLQYCAKKDIMLLPGVFTPGDVATSLEFGYKTMKLFPAGCAPKGYLKALKGPYDEANYIAIGGVTIDNINDYFKEGYMGIGLASNLMPLSVLKDKNWDLGVSYVQKYVSRVKRRV